MGSPKKFRQRYVAVEVEESPSRTEITDFVSGLNHRLDSFPPVSLIFYKVGCGEALLECGHLQLERVKEGIGELEELEARILGVSGTIKKAVQKFLS